MVYLQKTYDFSVASVFLGMRSNRAWMALNQFVVAAMCNKIQIPIPTSAQKIWVNVIVCSRIPKKS
jgi:hypothetical protein